MTSTTVDRTFPFYDPQGGMPWPENEEYSLQLMRLLDALAVPGDVTSAAAGALRAGGDAIGECMDVARAIDPLSAESWFREWTKIADVNKARGDLEWVRGRIDVAGRHWLRAISYYRTSQEFMPDDDIRQAAALAQMNHCARHFVAHAMPGGEVVDLPWAATALQGYVLPAPGRTGRQAPIVVCIGSPEQYKEDGLDWLPRLAHERGLSLVLVDLPGQGHRWPAGHATGRYDIETAISAWVDYLLDRHDVDPEKIAVVGHGLGASFATRGACFDDRFAAAVCDAGIWDLQERAFLAARLSGGSVPAAKASDEIVKLCRSALARTIACPVLVALGEHDWLDAAHVTRCCDALRSDGLDVTLKIIPASETGAPAVSHAVIFDWLADRLGHAD